MSGSIDLSVSGGTVPYSFAWNNGAQTEDIAGLSPSVYSVTITDANGCTVSGNFTITEPPALVLNGQAHSNSCYGVTDASIDITITGGVMPYSTAWSNMSWSSTVTAEDLSGIAPGTYDVLVTDANGCTASQQFSITGAAELQLAMDSVYTIFAHESVTLNTLYSGGTGNYTFTWNPTDDLDCPDCPEPSASPLTDTRYTVTITDANGCTISGSSLVIVLHELYVPNTFTPNGDGINDYFSAVSRSVQEYRLMIFNRWGDMIFESDKIDQGWDGNYAGSEAKQDVYAYRIEARLYNGEYRELLGQVNLIR
jgi:gliding motility-associated-like protein